MMSYKTLIDKIIEALPLRSRFCGEITKPSNDTNCVISGRGVASCRPRFSVSWLFPRKRFYTESQQEAIDKIVELFAQ